MKKYNYEQINKYVQQLIEIMDIEYPNDYELVINRMGAAIKSTQPVLCFVKNDDTIGLTNLSETEKKDITQIIKEFQKNMIKEFQKDNQNNE